MKKVLITGGTGFIGGSLKEQLKDEFEIISPEHQELELMNQTSVEQYLRFHKVDFIIHSAMHFILGIPEEKQENCLKNNMLMFLNLERCCHLYKKMFYFGSGAEYGKLVYKPLMKENYFDTTIPNDEYGLSKYIMSKFAAKNEKLYDLRLFGVFGPRENYNYRFISNCICKILEKKDIIIRRNVCFDYLYINDLVRIMRWFLNHTPKFKHYNISTGASVDILSIAMLIKEKLNANIKITVENESMGLEYSGNNGRLLSELGEFSFTPLEQAIDELIFYYKSIDYQLEGNY